MNALDWILLALLALTAVRGLSRGFVRELSGVAAPAAGLAAALFLYKWGAGVLRLRFHLEFVPEVVAFVILFLIAFLLVKIVANMIREGLEAAQLDKVDRGLGFVLGLAEGIVVVAIVLLVMQVQPLFDTKALLASSVFGKTLLPVIGPEVAKALNSLGSQAGAAVPAKPLAKP